MSCCMTSRQVKTQTRSHLPVGWLLSVVITNDRLVHLGICQEWRSGMIFLELENHPHSPCLDLSLNICGSSYKTEERKQVVWGPSNQSCFCYPSNTNLSLLIRTGVGSVWPGGQIQPRAFNYGLSTASVVQQPS